MMPFDSTTVPLEHGTTLIEASAGTGKTYSIAALFLRFVLEKHLPVQKILAVTYTVAATQELRDRVRKRIRAALTSLRAGEGESDPVVAEFLRNGGDVPRALRELDLAVQSFDEAPIFTIHGFCQRALQDHAFESGSRYAATLADSTPLFEEVAGDFWRRTFYQAPPLLAALALAGEYSDCATPDPWVELLQRTRNHPNLVVLPGADAESAQNLVDRATAAYAHAIELWRAGRCEIETILREDKALSRDAKKGFGKARLEGLLAAVAALASADCEEEIAPGDLNALAAFRSVSIENCTKANKQVPEHRFFAECETFCQAVERFFFQLNHEFLAYAGEELARRKKQRNLLTFDDLLTRLHHALQGAGGTALAGSLGAKYEVALIDEFQDTDPLQAAIFERIFADGRHWLFLIGDPKQAIYGFRGADVFAYLKAAASASRHYSLEVNWRSDSPLLDGFNALFAQVRDPFVIADINYVAVEASPEKAQLGVGLPPLEFRHLAVGEGEKTINKDRAQQGIVRAVAADIERLRAETPDFRLGGVAVLVRTGRQARAVQDALRERALPAVLHTEESVFHTPEAEVMQCLLQAVAEPRGGGRIKAALATPLFGCDATALAALDGDEDWLERFIDWRALWDQSGFVAMFRRVLTEQGVRRRLVELPGGERRLTNILHLAELLHSEETTRKLGPEALCGWLWEQRTAGRATAEAAQLRLESDAEAVSIVTIHKSKGLEYPVVFCPFLWEVADSPKRQTLCFHDHEGNITLDMRGKNDGPPEHKARAAEETLAEEVRLLYVALTRAKHRCVIYFADYRDLAKSPLARLFPDNDLKAGLRSLVNAAPEAVAVRAIAALPGDEVAAPEALPDDTEAVARHFRGNLARTAFITSFTGLTAGTGREEPERDQPLETEAVESIEVAPVRKEGPVHGIHFFEKGARAGDFFHDVLEHLDFRNPDELATLLPEKLALHGFAGTPFQDAVEEKLREVLEVELEAGLTLRQVGREDRLSEVDFSCRLPSLRPGDLSELFVAHGVPTLDAAELGRLRFSPVNGFLRGAIDLFFRHGDRYYLLDWKSNWLGNAPEDYDAAGVEAAMRSHHYALQAHLYVLAADRYLASRLPGYDYERNFGGVFYLFLRGVERGNASRGVYRIRPTSELMAGLRKLAEGGK